MASKKYVPLTKSNWKGKYHKSSRYNNKSEFTKVGDLSERLDILKAAVRGGCYSGRDGGPRQDWHEQWKHDTKVVDMWRAADDPDDPRPNLKSPFAYNACETAMTELWDTNPMPSVYGLTKKGEKYEKVIENIIKYPLLKYSQNDIYMDVFQEALWIGNSFVQDTYKKVVRKAEFKKLKGFDKKELKRMEKNDIAIYVDKEYIEYNDTTKIHLSPFEYYPDNMAKYQHDVNKGSEDGIREYELSYDKFRRLYDNRPEYRNVDKVTPGAFMERKENTIFQFPDNFNGSDNVLMWEWEDRTQDITRHVANGIWLGDIPLDNHKQLSVTHFGAIKIPHQFYYMGLGRVIEGFNAEDEVMRNKLLEVLELSITPPIIASNQVAGEFKDQYDSAKYSLGEIISISGNPNEINWMVPPISKLAEVFGMRAQIKEDAMSVSLINPSASNMPANDQTATETIALQTATMKGFAKTMKSFARGLKTSYKIQFATQRQEYPLQMEPETIKIREGDSKNLHKSRSFYSQDIEIFDTSGKITVEKKPGKKFPFIVKDEYLDIDDDDIQIVVNAESMHPMSKLNRTRKSEQALAQLMPLYIENLKNPELLKDPRIAAIHRDYVLSHGFDESDYLQSETEDEDEMVERAIKQEAIMWKNSKLRDGVNDDKYKMVIGEYDEPIEHLNHHLRKLKELRQMKDEKIAKLEEIAAEVTQMAMEGGRVSPDLSKEANLLSDELDILLDFIDQLQDHYKTDRLTRAEAEQEELAQQTGMEGGQQSLQSPAGQPMGQPMQGGNIPSPVNMGNTDLTMASM